MNTEPREILALQFTEQELETPADHEDQLAQAQRLLARLLVQAWLADHKLLDKSPES